MEQESRCQGLGKTSIEKFFSWVYLSVSLCLSVLLSVSVSLRLSLSLTLCVYVSLSVYGGAETTDWDREVRNDRDGCRKSEIGKQSFLHEWSFCYNKNSENNKPKQKKSVVERKQKQPGPRSVWFKVRDWACERDGEERRGEPGQTEPHCLRYSKCEGKPN